MGVMALVNLVSIVLLSRWAFGTLADYEAGLTAGSAGRQRAFSTTANPLLPAALRSDAWS